jgi:ABC-2 type transport system permease protein
MPLFFASNAIYPIDLMPRWLQAVADVNPLTYLVDGLRATMVRAGPSQFGVAAGAGGMPAFLALQLRLAAGLYPGPAR